MEIMQSIADNSFAFTLTDIPYDVVSRTSNGLRSLDKSYADIKTFELEKFLEEVTRVTHGSIVIFCSREQFSTIYDYFAHQKGTVRPIIWEKTNPSPMNGQYIYLNGIETAVWFKPRGYKTFNAHCKNVVMRHPNGSRKIHPTEKNHSLLEEIILDNTKPGDIVFDPCAGSGSTLLVAKTLDRDFYGIEINKDYYEKAKLRLCE